MTNEITTAQNAGESRRETSPDIIKQEGKNSTPNKENNVDEKKRNSEGNENVENSGKDNEEKK